MNGISFAEMTAEEGYETESDTDSLYWGYLPGTTEKLLLIKTGMGGNIYGYHRKYYHIARYFQSLGYHVLCCSTPQRVNDQCSFETVIEIAKMQLGDRFENCTIHYMGISHGAYQAIVYGSDVPQIKSMLLINPPLTINFQKQIAVLRTTEKRCTVVMGTKDPSFRLWPWICLIDNPNLELVEASGADHHFKGMDKMFFELPQTVFLKE